METWLAQILKDYGPSVALVAFVIWDGRNREQRYIKIIEKLSDSFQTLKRDVSEIKKKLDGSGHSRKKEE